MVDKVQPQLMLRANKMNQQISKPRGFLGVSIKTSFQYTVYPCITSFIKNSMK